MPRKTTRKSAWAKREAVAEEPRERGFGRLKDELGALRDTVAGELRRAVDAAGERGIVDTEKLKRAEADLRERMQALGEQAAVAGRALGDETRRLASDERVRAAASTGVKALQGLASSLRGMAERMEEVLAEHPRCRAGESQAAGSYVCRACGAATVLAEPGPLAPCRCGGKVYQRAD